MRIFPALDHLSNVGDELHNRFDRAVKGLADEAPLLLARIVDIPGVRADSIVTPLRPESSPPAVFPDYVALLVVNQGQEAFTFHVEFHLDYYREIPSEMARYGMSLAAQHQRPVESVLVLLRPDRVPAEVPEIGEYAIGKTRTTHPFQVARLWEIPPDEVLQSGNPRMLPWAVLMKSTAEQAASIAAEVRRSADPETIVRFLSLGSLRYDRNVLEEMLGGPKMGLREAIIRGSSLLEEAREEGKAEGNAEEARRLLRLSLRAKFPGLESMPEIDSIRRVESLESILVGQVLASTDAQSVRQAIVAAATRPAS